jgi:Arc/MetJ family transcription regulator
LTDAYKVGIIACMRTTLNIDDDLLEKAREITGEREKTALVRMGLQALIEREAARRLAALGGSMPNLEVPPRRRQRRASE